MKCNLIKLITISKSSLSTTTDPDCIFESCLLDRFNESKESCSESEDAYKYLTKNDNDLMYNIKYITNALRTKMIIHKALSSIIDPPKSIIK